MTESMRETGHNPPIQAHMAIVCCLGKGDRKQRKSHPPTTGLGTEKRNENTDHLKRQRQWNSLPREAAPGSLKVSKAGLDGACSKDPMGVSP